MQWSMPLVPRIIGQEDERCHAMLSTNLIRVVFSLAYTDFGAAAGPFGFDDPDRLSVVVKQGMVCKFALRAICRLRNLFK
jgi:hypothetical protein